MQAGLFHCGERMTDALELMTPKNASLRLNTSDLSFLEADLLTFYFYRHIRLGTVLLVLGMLKSKEMTYVDLNILSVHTTKSELCCWVRRDGDGAMYTNLLHHQIHVFSVLSTL